jgi:DNA-directed RNA polymerase specialized sigma24 family protein
MNNKYITNLIESAQNGNINSFLQLADVYSGNVYAVCLRTFIIPQLAEVLTIEILNHAWQNLKHLRGNSSFQLWLNGITVYYILEEHRTNKCSTELLEKKIIKSLEPDSVIIDALSSLEKLILDLPQEDRIMFILHEIIGYSASEISDLLSKYRADEIRNIIRSIRTHFIEELKF